MKYGFSDVPPMVVLVVVALVATTTTTTTVKAQTMDCSTAISCEECLVSRCAYTTTGKPGGNFCWNSCDESADADSSVPCHSSRTMAGQSAAQLCETLVVENSSPPPPPPAGADDIDITEKETSDEGTTTTSTSSSAESAETTISRGVTDSSSSAAPAEVWQGLKIAFLLGLLVAGVLV